MHDYLKILIEKSKELIFFGVSFLLVLILNYQNIDPKIIVLGIVSTFSVIFAEKKLFYLIFAIWASTLVAIIRQDSYYYNYSFELIVCILGLYVIIFFLNKLIHTLIKNK